MTKNKWWYAFKETLFYVAFAHVIINALIATLEGSLNSLNMLDVMDLQYFFPLLPLTTTTFLLSGIPVVILYWYFLNKWRKQKHDQSPRN